MLRLRHHLKKAAHNKREVVVLVVSAAFLVCGVFLIWASSLRLPDLGSFEDRLVAESTKIYDRTGKILLYDIHQTMRRTVVPSGDISRNLKNATVAIEDSEFYEHRGIKPRAILRAVFANLISGSYSQGGSTITQQVIKNTLLTTEKSIARKLKEWILALKLERVMSKDAILTLYINESPYGGSVYGAEEASKNFFGKHASELTLAESAYMAALPNAPSRLSPYGGNREALENRKELVLSKMLEKNFISQKEYEEARQEKVEFLPLGDSGIKAPHFVMYIKELLENKYGDQVMESRGLRVITSVDLELQQKAEEIVEKFATENKEKYNASNAALVAIDPKTGDILAMVGSRNYFDQEIDGNFNVTTAFRQPGSAFKPFVYAAAFAKGYIPETVLFDVKTEFSVECKPDGTPILEGNEDKCYSPENYDEIFRGPISLRSALAQSINIPAIKTLYLVGIRNAIDLASRMGISSLTDPDRYGLTLVLGGGEVKLLEMASAYGVFANEGTKVGIRPILQIEDSAGNVIESYDDIPRQQVLEKEVARKISDILSDNVARSPSYGYNSPLNFPGFDVAAKTGTTNDYRDAWIIGYTPTIAVGAWAGNNDNTPMEKRVAGFIVAPMWNAFMQEALHYMPVERFRKPAEEDLSLLKPVLRGIWTGGENYFVDKRTGQTASDLTPEEFREEKIIPAIHSILYWVNKNDPRGPRPADPGTDPQFYLWEEAIKKWVEANPNTPGVKIETPIIQLQTPVSQIPSKEKPVFLITSPAQLIMYRANNSIPVTFSLSNFSAVRIEVYVNGQLLGSMLASPFDFSFTPKEVAGISTYNNIRLVAVDANGNRTEVSGPFLVSGF